MITNKKNIENITEFPTEPGWYWFYGFMWGADRLKLVPMQVIKLTNGHLLYIAKGAFIYKNENHIGKFYPAILPNPSNEDATILETIRKSR